MLVTVNAKIQRDKGFITGVTVSLCVVESVRLSVRSVIVAITRHHRSQWLHNLHRSAPH